MPEASPPLSPFDKEFSPILGVTSKTIGRFERFKSKIDPDDLKDLTALVTGAALLISGSQAKHVAASLDQQISSNRVACYADKGPGHYQPECTDSTLAAFDIGAKIFTIIGFAGGTLMTGTLLASQVQRRNGGH